MDAAERISPNEEARERPVVAETVVDIPETIVDDERGLVLIAGDGTFDATAAAASGGRMAQCAKGETFTIHGNDVLGSGSQGIVVRATDSSGESYAAKISYPVAKARDRRNRKAVLDSLMDLMDEHPLGAHHFKQTHLMPVYAYGKVTGRDGAGSVSYDVAIMALCDRSLGEGPGCGYDELRTTVLPQTADGLRFLHVQGIVHRDIKPKNLYLLDGSIVLGDFGISSLLDEGRDTGATVFDKRTPGYSPHSSVIQRENDWYALGYTLWTLYNGGVHPHQALIDAGDLSAVLAGGRPVEFIPHHPDEASLGDLIYGLTLESSRGRLGYDDIQEWLASPETFEFTSPFDEGMARLGYQFRGKTFRDDADLADAMTEAWEDAKEHIYSQTLEEHCKRVGHHDLAVALHGITVTDPVTSKNKDVGLSLALTMLKGSAEEFVWQGIGQKRDGVADREFERLAATPCAFYDACSHRAEVADLLCMLRVAYAGVAGWEGQEAAIRATYDDLQASNTDPILIGDKLLTLFEALCSDKRPVREFYRDYGMYGNTVWVKRHIEGYRPTSSEARRAVHDIAVHPLPEAADPLNVMRGQLERLDRLVRVLVALLPHNPFDRMVGSPVSGTVVPLMAEGYACAEAYGDRCTIGYALTVVASEAHDAVCDFAKLRRKAVSNARDEAKRIRARGESYGQSRLVDGHSVLRHLFLMVCIVVAWVVGCDLLEGAVPVCQELFARYEPLMTAGGAMSLQGILPGVNLGVASLAFVFWGFTTAAFCILLRRVVQLVPVALASSLRRHAQAKAERLERKARDLESRPLADVIVSLLDEKPLPAAKGRVGTPSGKPQSLDDVLANIERVLWVVYGLSVVMLIMGILGTAVMSMPYLLFRGTIASNPEELPLVLMTCQWTLVVGLAIYFAIVLLPSRLRPSMVRVVLILAALLGLCAFCQSALMLGMA